jgi:ribosomal protein S18 acetylase RimI-like enzyme
MKPRIDPLSVAARWSRDTSFVSSAPTRSEGPLTRMRRQGKPTAPMMGVLQPAIDAPVPVVVAPVIADNASVAGVSVRNLSPNDSGIYRALMLRGYTEHETAFTSTFEERATKTPDWWIKRLQDPTTITIGAFDAGDALIGTVRLEAFQRLRERHKMHLAAMYVMRDYAGKGVGRKLVDEALAESRKMAGIEIMSLTVTADNLPAVRLYGKVGFQEFGREPRAVKTPAAYLDKLHMWRPVSADYVVQN